MRYVIYSLFASLLLLSGGAQSQQPITLSNELLQELQKYELQIEELESQFGPLSETILEPLSSISALLEAQGNFEALVEIQGRQFALMRINLGLEHPDLVRMVRAMIATDKRLGDWQAIADHLDLLRTLQAAIHGFHSDELFKAVEDQAQWYLARVAIDGSTRPGRNFMRARDLYKELEDLAEDRFGENNPELYPWYYKRANNLAQLVALLNAETGLAGNTFDELVRADGLIKIEQYSPYNNIDLIWGPSRRISLTRADLLLGEAYLRDGLRRIGKMRDIAEETDDMEAEAMANLYYADFRILLNRGASRNYRRMHEQLLEVGIESQRIETLFNRPTVIPLPIFFDRFADLEAYQAANIAKRDYISEDLLYVGEFTAWDEDAKSIIKPLSTDPLLRVELPYYQADLSFRISTRGKPSSIDIDVLSMNPDERLVERRATRALRDIRFRPSIVEGKPKRIRDLQLRYYYFERDD